MIIYLYGPDSYRRQQKLNEIKESYGSKNSIFSVENFNMENPDEIERLKDFILQRGMFDLKKMAVIKNISESGSEALENLKKLLFANLKNENLILIIFENGKLAKDFDFLLTNPAISQEFQNLSGDKLKFFINSEAKKRNIELPTKAIEFLADNFTNNSWEVINELDKLQFLNLKKLDVKDLEKIIDSNIEPNIFKFTGAISKNSPVLARLISLEMLFLAQEEPAKIFNILAKNPYLNLNQLKILADYDVEIKSGKMDYETALFELTLI